MSMERVLKLATPATAATLSVPLRVPFPGGLVPIARVMRAVDPAPVVMTAPAPFLDRGRGSH